MYAGLPSRIEADMKQFYVELLMKNQTREQALEKLKKYKINITALPGRKVRAPHSTHYSPARWP